MELDFMTLDVFSDTPFRGNQLAVVFDADDLDVETMQAIAREFNFSETAFVLRPRAGDHTARLRIFTRLHEVPFAGHPNIGTSVALALRRDLDRLPPTDVMHLEQSAGVVKATVSRNHGHPNGARIVVPERLSLGMSLPVGTIAACLSLPASSVKTERHVPVMASVGLPFVLTEVASRQALATARPDLGSFEAATQDHGVHRHGFAVYAYYRPEPLSSLIHARMFAPLSDTLEDPATGSAGAALAGLLAHLDGAADGTVNISIRQGEDLGRRSEIQVSAVKADGTVQSVTVEGACVVVTRGVLTTVSTTAEVRQSADASIVVDAGGMA